MADHSKVIFRQRAAAIALDKALDECIAAGAEFTALQGSTWTNPYFYVNGDVNGTLRTDLDISKQDFLDIVAANANIPTAAAAYRAALSKAK